MDDRELLIQSLRDVLTAPGTGSKALAAKAAAARQLALITGLTRPSRLDVIDKHEERFDEDAPDPMSDLDMLEAQRRKQYERKRTA